MANIHTLMQFFLSSYVVLPRDGRAGNLSFTGQAQWVVTPSDFYLSDSTVFDQTLLIVIVSDQIWSNKPCFSMSVGSGTIFYFSLITHSWVWQKKKLKLSQVIILWNKNTYNIYLHYTSLCIAFSETLYQRNRTQAPHSQVLWWKLCCESHW